MTALFYAASAIAILSTGLAITRSHPVHALLYIVVSLFAVAAVIYTLGAPFVAALEVIIYAGAIIVLILFVVMLLGLGPGAVRQERKWLTPSAFVLPCALALLLGAEVLWAVFDLPWTPAFLDIVPSREVGRLLFGPYLLGVEVASMLLLAALVSAFHLARRDRATEPKVGLALRRRKRARAPARAVHPEPQEAPAE